MTQAPHLPTRASIDGKRNKHQDSWEQLEAIARTAGLEFTAMNNEGNLHAFFMDVPRYGQIARRRIQGWQNQGWVSVRRPKTTGKPWRLKILRKASKHMDLQPVE